MAWPEISKRLRSSDAIRHAPTRTTVIGQSAMGRYEILKLIGEGSNGEVYLARVVKDPTRYVVVKRVKENIRQNPKFQQFFDSEVQSMARFRHPYVVQLIDASIDDPIGPCLILEYIHGVTLEAILVRHRRWFPERIGRIFGQLCHALQAAHDAGIMHRDLKPANLMITDFNTPNESLKVMDFGFAGFTERPHIQIAELTGCGPIFACGTPAYVSPEMIRADSVDRRADLYSVGVILYEMITGRLPFNQMTVQEILSAHVRESPPTLRSLGIHDVNPIAEAVLQISLAKYPNERHQSARELALHFGQAIGTEIWESTAPPGYEASSDTATNHVKTILHAPTISNAPVSQKEPINDLFTFFDKFEATLPERLAAVKLRGFVEAVCGCVVTSEPGIIHLRVDLPSGWQEPKTRSGVIGWIQSIRKFTPEPGREPIDVKLEMKKIDANRVAVLVTLQPMAEYPPGNHETWRERCEEIYNILRMYLMAA